MSKQYAEWRKSRHSEPNGSCVEVGRAVDGTIGVRDTQVQGTGPILGFSRTEWAAFLGSIKANR